MALTLERLIDLVPDEFVWTLMRGRPGAFPLDTPHVVCRMVMADPAVNGGPVVQAYGPTAVAAMTDCLIELGVEVPYR